MSIIVFHTELLGIVAADHLQLYRPEIAIHFGALNLNWLYTLFIEPKIAIHPLFAEPEMAIHRLAVSLKWLYSPGIRAEGRHVAPCFLGYA